MIKYIEQKDIFESTANALVNPVNCVGVMGKGLAKGFKQLFPECVPPYEEACSRETLSPGKLIFVRTCVQPDLFCTARPAIILFPTKKHWRGKSQLRWIEAGLQKLKNSYRDWGIASVAIPQLGCGLGGLEWKDVKEVIERLFEQEDLEVNIYIQSNSQDTAIRDILRQNLDIIFVGTAVGKTSANYKHYYAHRTNSFYRDLYSSKFTPLLLTPKDDTKLPEFGIGLTDVVKRKITSDDRLLNHVVLSSGSQELKIKLERYRPKWVCFNGKKAFESFSNSKAEYGEQNNFEEVRVFVVPSTSGRVSSRRILEGKTRSEWFAELYKRIQ